MTESVVRRGHDTWVSIDFPNTESPDAKYLKLKTAANRALVYLPLPSIRGRTVLSASLSLHVKGTWASQTITATRIAATWTASNANWTNQPATTGTGSSAATGALTDGAQTSIDVTAMLQTVANGSAWYGFQIITNTGTQQSLYGFDSGVDSWALTYELSDAPEQPSGLVPDGGVVSKTKPTLSWDFTDFGGTSTNQAALQVQIDPNASSPTNLLSQAASDMESGITAWTAAGTPTPALTNSSAQAYEGTKSLLITWAGSTSNPQAQATVTGLTIGLTYTAFFNVYVPTGDAGVIPILGTAVGSTVTAKDAWTPCSVSFVASATSHIVAIRGATPANTDLCYVDGVRVSLGSAIVPLYDSGVVTSTDPEFDLSLTDFVALTAGQTTQWRVRVKDDAALWSDWSDWASWTYRAKATLTMDSPVATTLSDPTPTILAHISTSNLAAYRIRITNGTDRTRVRYDSGKRTAASLTAIALTLPQRNDDGVRIFTDDVTYQLNVRAWDTYDREGTVGDGGTYVEQWVNVTFTDSGGVTAPAALTVTQATASPRVTLTWTRGVAPDAWVIIRDSKIAGRLDPASVSFGGGTYTWTDGGYSEPYQSHAWKVKAIVGGVQSAPTSTVNKTTVVNGVWLLAGVAGPAGDVVLDETSISDFRTNDRRATYKPLNLAYDVDIISGMEGLSGQFTGSISIASDQNIDTAITRLQAIKEAPDQSVRLVYADKSIPVKIRNLSVVPREDFNTRTRRHVVAFEFWQSGNFDDEAD